VTATCPDCGDEIDNALAIIEEDGACPNCGTGRDELFDIALDTDPDRSPAETIAGNYEMEADG
jgi:RNA polymerase subunit RPABC4/transcription elongation factor Spt4